MLVAEVLLHQAMSVVMGPIVFLGPEHILLKKPVRRRIHTVIHPQDALVRMARHVVVRLVRVR